MPIKVIEPQRLYRQISDQLRTLIIAGEFPVGSRLPSERDLAVQLGVSRPSLREALIALEVQGYIEVRMGSGIYICEPPSPSRARPDLSGEEGPLEVIQARTVLEGEVAAIAAKAGRKPHYDAIEEAIDMMEADARAGIKPVEADRLFHVRIAEATGNSVLVDVVKRMFDFRMGPLFDQLDSHFETNDVWQDAIREHREILQALRSKKPELARSAMQHHMGIAFKRLTSSLVDGKKPGGRRLRVAAAQATAVAPRASAVPRKGGK
ncbi:GntR family transcriptional regulator [Pollutimonas subterranea]|uniref:GntR family transcriptional regulator n=1 Tax=Pollutimonas subterranea TaxID=2045210 RepID=A0A2N4U0X5_9BURK|nr:FadR/GntR family transcriptional regulator [Pollutimonas subterranea]PLC48647.1 GntR family transcriptional regulator [Pollutimonas subterranea]